jgi:hypothetical protein
VPSSTPEQLLGVDPHVFKETRFGYDFSQVPVHTEAGAVESAQAANGLAFTEGWGDSNHRCQSLKSRFDLLDNPAKSPTPLPEEEGEEKPAPKNGSATIQCDGNGGYEIVYNSWENAKCGTKGCVTVHENSHIEDWKAKWPDGCKDKARGYLPQGDPPDKPLMTVAEYNAFLKKSECKAHTADLACAEALPKPDNCKKTIDDYIKLTKEQKEQWC